MADLAEHITREQLGFDSGLDLSAQCHSPLLAHPISHLYTLSLSLMKVKKNFNLKYFNNRTGGIPVNTFIEIGTQVALANFLCFLICLQCLTHLGS